VLFSSGLIAGGAIAGIFVAGLATLLSSRAAAENIAAADYLAHLAGLQSGLGGFATHDVVAILIFFVMGALLWRVASRR
jgi:hypothetical protein